MMQKIRFQGQEYILIEGSAIATEEAYKNGIEAFAYLSSDGNIRRYCSIVGTHDDIEFLEEIPDIEMTIEGFANLVSGCGWPKI